MRVYRSLAEVPANFGPSALTIGNFDGVHTGHRRILRRLVALAGQRGWKPSVLTFDPHPTRVVAPERTPPLLTSPLRRAELMREEGVEEALILPFVPEVARLSPEDFVREIVVGRLERGRRWWSPTSVSAIAMQATSARWRNWGGDSDARPKSWTPSRAAGGSGGAAPFPTYLGPGG